MINLQITCEQPSLKKMYTYTILIAQMKAVQPGNECSICIFFIRLAEDASDNNVSKETTALL